MKTLLSAIAFSILIGSCTYKEANEFIPPPPPDSVSFSEDILPILQTSCFGPGYPDPSQGPTCHYPPGSIGNPKIFFDECNNLSMEAKNGDLYTRLLAPGADMPQYPSPPLPASDTALFGVWIREGAPCN